MAMKIDVIYDAAQTAERRERRRYEIARDCLAGLLSSESEEDGYYTALIAATRAIEFADALLAELEKQ